MEDENQTVVDKLWKRIMNQKMLAIIIVIGGVIIGISTFSDSLFKLFQIADDVISDNQTTKTFKTSELKVGKFDSNYFNDNREVSEKNESDMVNLAKDNITVDLSMQNDDSSDDIYYNLKKEKNGYKITPYNPYLSLLNHGGPITTISSRTPFNFKFPTFDLKIINNSSKTIFFTKAILNVSASKSDPFPIILIHEGTNMQFPISNIGWGKVYNCRIKFNLTPGKESSNSEEYQFEQNIGDFDHSYRIDLTEYFKSLGVKTDIVSNSYRERAYKIKMLDALGPFQDDIAYINGIILYEGKDAMGKTVSDKLKFQGIVSLAGHKVRSSAPPSFVYDVALETDKVNYKKEIPISQAIKAGDYDRFFIKISAAKSSRHKMDLILFYNNNEQFIIPNIYLNYFMSTKDSSYIKNRKERQNEE